MDDKNLPSEADILTGISRLDLSPLIEYLEKGGKLTDSLREYLVMFMKPNEDEFDILNVRIVAVKSEPRKGLFYDKMDGLIRNRNIVEFMRENIAKHSSIEAAHKEVVSVLGRKRHHTPPFAEYIDPQEPWRMSDAAIRKVWRQRNKDRD